MSHSYCKICLQLVFAVKYRSALLKPNWRQKIFEYISNIINKSGCRTIIVNGVENHVHCLFWLKPNISISELVKAIKAKSSKHINDCRLTDVRFEWQAGYGIFSYHESLVGQLVNYIKNQEQHHKKQDLKDEVISILNEFNIPHDKEDAFQDPL